MLARCIMVHLGRLPGSFDYTPYTKVVVDIPVSESGVSYKALNVIDNL